MFRMMLSGLLLCLSVGAHALAQEVPERFTVEMDKAKIMRLPRTAATVIIGNPAIADAVVHNGRLLMITGKAFGATNLIALDARGNIIVEQEVRVVTPQMAAITYYRGNSQRTYSCAQNCELIPNVGNDPEVFDQLMSQQKDKSEQGNTAAVPN